LAIGEHQVSHSLSAASIRTSLNKDLIHSIEFKHECAEEDIRQSDIRADLAVNPISFIVRAVEANKCVSRFASYHEMTDVEIKIMLNVQGVIGGSESGTREFNKAHANMILVGESVKAISIMYFY
jgi:hypothetical protein